MGLASRVSSRLPPGPAQQGQPSLGNVLSGSAAPKPSSGEMFPDVTSPQRPADESIGLGVRTWRGSLGPATAVGVEAALAWGVLTTSRGHVFRGGGGVFIGGALGCSLMTAVQLSPKSNPFRKNQSSARNGQSSAALVRPGQPVGSTVFASAFPPSRTLGPGSGPRGRVPEAPVLGAAPHVGQLPASSPKARPRERPEFLWVACGLELAACRTRTVTLTTPLLAVPPDLRRPLPPGALPGVHRGAVHGVPAARRGEALPQHAAVHVRDPVHQGAALLVLRGAFLRDCHTAGGGGAALSGVCNTVSLDPVFRPG